MAEKRKPTRGSRPARVIAAGEFKATCLELMDQVKERGAEFVITKRGESVARLVPVDDADAPNPVGFMRGTVLRADDIVAPDEDAWRESPSDPLERE